LLRPPLDKFEEFFRKIQFRASFWHSYFQGTKVDKNERILVAVDQEVLDELIERVQKLEDQLARMANPQLQKEHYYLTEACRLKGVNYNSLCSENFLHFRPNNGIPDLILNRRDCWRRETIVAWLRQSDADLNNMLRERQKASKAS